MMLTEHEDHILARTNDLLGMGGKEADEWAQSILVELDNQFTKREPMPELMKPLVLIGRSGKASLYQEGVHAGPITLQDAETLARYNLKQTPAEIFEQYNRGWLEGGANG